MTTIDYRKFITIEPDKLGGRPCIRGHRLAVEHVFEYLASGMTVDELLAEFPFLTREDIQACFAWAADWERHVLYTSAPSAHEDHL